MYYRIERTYLTRADGGMERELDPRPHLVAASAADAAARSFVAAQTAKLVGDVTALQGDKATATAIEGSRVCVVFVERAADAIRDAVHDQKEPGPRSHAAPGRD